mgnify:CR=1 FL=1
MAKLSYKVSYYALYVMFAIILVVLGMFFFGGDAQGDAVLASVDAEMWQPAHTDALIYLMYILFFVAIIATVVGVLFQFGAALKDNPGAALEIFDWFWLYWLQLLLFLGLWVVKNHLLFRVIAELRTYLFWLKLLTWFLYSIYILFAGTVLAIIF